MADSVPNIAYSEMLPEQFKNLTLNELPAACWSLLEEGATQRKSALHTPVLATIRDQQPESRVVVLRAVDSVKRILDCHTDCRTQKVQQLDVQPAMSWVFYDAARKLQIRVRGEGCVLTGAKDTDERWSAMADYSRLCYAQRVAPGQVVDQIVDATPNPSVEDVDEGRGHFAIVRCLVTEIEWLYLCQTGHQRAVIRWDNEQAIANWIMP